MRMGYTLTIGNAQVFYDNNPDWPYRKIEAKGEKLDNAPAFGEPTDYTNSRWPSYTAWHNFCEFTGLEKLFYDEEYGLISTHPGSVPLTSTHKEAVDMAYLKFKKDYPNAVAEFKENNPVKNAFLCRLEWLKFWVDWSLANCEKPIFYNS